eukprot:COSAG02_NODE_57899_length_279_cov_0.577778_1_plen_22_part_01
MMDLPRAPTGLCSVLLLEKYRC